jgi:hypothetical protein
MSHLRTPVRETADAVVMVRRETDPEEAKTLLAMCQPRPCAVSRSTRSVIFRPQKPRCCQAAEEAHGQIRRFQLAPRLTAHIRHRTKYLDMPVPESHAFVFTGDGRSGARARRLKESLGLLATLSADRLVGHLRRHDSSNWFADVFRDRLLANHVRNFENRVDLDDAREVADVIAQAIRARYETAVTET